MAILTPGHVEQIKKMRAEGQKYPVIMDFFQKTYDIKLTNNNIAYPDTAVGQKRHYKKRTAIKKESAIAIVPKRGEEEVKVVSEFDELIRKAFEIHKKEFIAKVAHLIAPDKITSL